MNHTICAQYICIHYCCIIQAYAHLGIPLDRSHALLLLPRVRRHACAHKRAPTASELMAWYRALEGDLPAAGIAVPALACS